MGRLDDREREAGLGVALPRRRQLAASLLGSIAIAGLTLAMLAVHPHLGLPSILLLYLFVVVAIAVLGGLRPALVAALASPLLINWFFTPPTHTWTIADPENLFGLVAFVLVAAVVSVLVDREARARAEAERRRSQADSLVRVNELKTAILASVSHDLRTPLASIKASVSSLREPDVIWPKEQMDDFLATIELETDRLTALVGNLLDMSRIQTGSLALSRRALGLDEIVPRALSSLPDQGAEVEVDVPETLPRVVVDADLIERAVANVVANARKWSPLDRPPHVLGMRAGGRVELWVIDHGPGVPLVDRSRMFEPFQQLGERPGHNGLGLGLAVARGFVDAVDGELRAVETPSGGLTMVMSFEAAG
ncbi:MAG: DUF4118 domain-containing protein [Actinomycetota bacterium]